MSGRGECVCVCIPCDLDEDVANLRFEAGVEIRKEETQQVLVMLRMLNS